MMSHPDNFHSDEAAERLLDPHRQEEQRKAREEAETRLAGRGIEVRPDDADDDVAVLQDTIERFEQEVQRMGGDLMVNHLGSSRPEDPAFVPPRREPSESISMYLRRLEDALSLLVERTRPANPW